MMMSAHNRNPHGRKRGKSPTSIPPPDPNKSPSHGYQSDDYYPIGTPIERELDGKWYLARVVSCSSNKSSDGSSGNSCNDGSVMYSKGSRKGLWYYTIEYVDDGNEEEMVEHDELRLAAGGHATLPNHIEKIGVPKPPMCLPIQELLVGDEIRYEDKTPRIIIHNKTGMIQADEDREEGA